LRGRERKQGLPCRERDAGAERWPSRGGRDARPGQRVEDRAREAGLRVAMQDAKGSRRGLVKAGLAAAAAFSLRRHARARAAPAEIKLPENIPVDRFDFEAKGNPAIVVLGLVAIVSTPAVARAADPDWKAVERELGKSGQIQPGEVFRIGMPRTDLEIGRASCREREWTAGHEVTANTIEQ